MRGCKALAAVAWFNAISECPIWWFAVGRWRAAEPNAPAGQEGAGALQEGEPPTLTLSISMSAVFTDAYPTTRLAPFDGATVFRASRPFSLSSGAGWAERPALFCPQVKPCPPVTIGGAWHWPCVMPSENLTDIA